LPLNNYLPVRVRFAPSPTGRTHLGSGRTALFNYLIARQTVGKFILRIEDTDQKRFVPGAEHELIESLKWLGLRWDEGPDVGGEHAPYRQSERREIYQQFARQLIDAGHAYYCFCTPERLARLRQEQKKQKQMTQYDGFCRRLDPDEARKRVLAGEKYVIRFKTPKEGSITVEDLLRGQITVENSMLDDIILVKSDGLAVYHLAAMVDDHLMDISHVIRGSEWLSTFPLHGHLIRAFGWQEPVFVHLSIFLKPSGKGKMSKRESNQLIQDGYSIFVSDLKDLGFIPEAVVNWIALMGWSYDDHTEFFTLKDLVDKFSLEKLNPSPAAINFTKLDHFNGLHIRQIEDQDLAQRVKPFFIKANLPVDDQKLLEVAPLIQERIITLDDSVEMAGFFFQDEIQVEKSELIGKQMSLEESIGVLQKAYAIMESVPNFNMTLAEEQMRDLVEKLGLKPGQMFGVLRVAVTGQTVSPPLFESMAVIGKEKVLERVGRAIRVLEKV
jgi:glutamyl-tRNA synthetase